MKRMILVLVLLQGCTHTLYQGDIVSTNNLDQQQAYRLWWIKTSVFSSDKGSGSMTLDMGCDSKTLTDSEQGIIMELPADKYRSTHGQTGSTLVCAEVVNLEKIKAYNSGDIIISTSCEPLADDFSLSPNTFPRVDMKHVFPIISREIEDAGFAPPRLECNG